MGYRVVLSWSQGAPGEQGSGFKVYRSVNGGSFSLRATLPLTQTSYEEEVFPGYLYTYRVYEYLTLPGGDVLSPYAQITVSLRLDYAFTASEKATADKEIFGEEQGAVSDQAKLAARQRKADVGVGMDLASLLAWLYGEDEGASEELGRLHLAEFFTLDTGEGSETVAFVGRGYWEPSASDSGVGEERSLVTAWLKAAERALGAEFTELEAILVAVDGGSGAERPISWLFVRRTGEVWGMTEIQLEAIQK